MKKVIILVLFVIFGSVLHAQTTQSIKGKITNPQTGEPIPDATIILEGTSYGAVTDINGEYEINNIPPGTYTIQVHAMGFQSTSSPITVTEGAEPVVFNSSLTEDTKHIKEIKVVKKLDRETDQSARKLEKDADNIKNVVSAQTIEKSPDITVANALQRVSGVTLQRTNQGDGRYAIIRGMDKRYNNTLVNGIKIPSPNMDDRYVPLDIMPSDLLQRMEVTKALRPDMEGDAIGGTVNLVMKEAPDSVYRKASFSTGYNQLFLNNSFMHYSPGSIQKDPYAAHGSNPNYALQSSDFSQSIFDYSTGGGKIGFFKTHPNMNALANLALGKRFFNNKLGILVGGSYQNLYRGAQSNYYYIFLNPNNNFTPQYYDEYKRFYSTHQIRQGYSIKADYVFNARHKISLYSIYFRTTDYEQRNTYDSTYYATSTNNSNYIYNRSKTSIQSVYNATLQGTHNITKNLLFDWSGVYSIATQKTPDWAEYQLDFSYQMANAHKFLDNIKYIWQRNLDQDLAGYASLAYTNKFWGVNWEFKAGGLYRHKNRSNYYNGYTLNNATFGVPFTNIDNINTKVYNPGGTGTFGEYNYTATEDITAGYGQIRAVFGRWNVLGGLRAEITNQQYKMQQVLPHTLNGETINYTDPLPSLHVKYALTEKSNLRASYFRGISRPNFYELVPYQIPGEFFTLTGNPYLKHTTSNNYDLRYELFPNSEDVIMIGTFYKFISNPIELLYNIYGNNAYGKSQDQLIHTSVQSGEPSTYQIMPFNFGNANNYGMELMFIKYLGDFGVSGNYTYTNSKMQNVKILEDAQTKVTGVPTTLLETRPMQGQSKGEGNLSLLYRNKRAKINLQLAYNYTGKRIVQVSPYYNLDYWQQPMSLLDFSGDVAVSRNKKWILFVKANNLLNTPYVVKLTTGLLVQKDYYSRNFQVGIRCSF